MGRDPFSQVPRPDPFEQIERQERYDRAVRRQAHVMRALAVALFPVGVFLLFDAATSEGASPGGMTIGFCIAVGAAFAAVWAHRDLRRSRGG